MLSGLLLMALQKAGPKIGQFAVDKIQEAFLGKETSLDDIKELVESLGESLKGLPEEVSHYLDEQKYLLTISNARHNIENSNIKHLLEFLDDGNQDQSYWGIANRLCLDMTGVNAHDMEKMHDTPKKINFRSRGYMFKTSNDTLRKRSLVTDYIKSVTDQAVTLGAAIVTIEHVATLALKKISEVKDGEFYEECQKRLQKESTKKYLPAIEDNSEGKGLTYILSPAINQSPRGVIGEELSTVYEKAATEGHGKGSPWLALKSYRFRGNTNKRNYLQWTNERNPDLSHSSKKNWYFQFPDEDREKVAIINYNNGANNMNLYIGYPNGYVPDSEGSSNDYGVYADTERETEYWYWYVQEINSHVVYYFKNGSSDVLKNILATGWRPLRDVCDPGGSFSEDNTWIIEPNV